MKLTHDLEVAVLEERVIVNYASSRLACMVLIWREPHEIT